MKDEIGTGKGKNYRINNCLVFDKRFLPGDPSCVRRTGSFRSELQSRSQLRCLRRWRCVAPAERRTARVMPAHRGGRRAAVAGGAAAPPLLVHAACKIHSIGACCCRPMQVPAAWVLPVRTRGSGIRNSNSKSRVTIHYTIQIQQLLFKFVALFKISCTIQIQNINSARALQLSGSGTQIHLLFDALCRALLVIM